MQCHYKHSLTVLNEHKNRNKKRKLLPKKWRGLRMKDTNKIKEHTEN